MNNALTWFEIPVNNLPRAVTFYSTLLGQTLTTETMGPHEMAVLPHDRGQGVGGCLIATAYQQPTMTGTIIYLPIHSGLDAALVRTEQAGGRIALEKTALPGAMGSYAHIIDSEGNRVGLHEFAH
jgi:uncharacterized protein